ncbi:MAG: NTP transferase domain-containing protein [Thermoflavifilum sp.]|nr:NTP transferase domain-containing protein [Thermoflavifilum sp.]
MKAIIPVAGAGTKLRPHTHTQPKALIPLAGKPLLDFIIEPLYEAGIKEFIFITGHLGEKIRAYIQQKYPHLQSHFVHQTDREGVGHAVWLTRELVQQDEVLIMLGDTICEFDYPSIIQARENLLGIKKVDDPRDFGVAEIDETHQKIVHVEEKPQIPTSNTALVGVYKIIDTNVLFECLSDHVAHNIRSHDEIQLTDAIECMIRKGILFKPFKVTVWFDCGRKDKLLESNATLLKKRNHIPLPEGAVENSIIVQPVSIAEGCRIRDSIIGPNVTIGEHAQVYRCIIQHSIIGSYSKLNEVVLSDSLIGSDAHLKGFSQHLNIGDNTEIDFA